LIGPLRVQQLAGKRSAHQLQVHFLASVGHPFRRGQGVHAANDDAIAVSDDQLLVHIVEKNNILEVFSEMREALAVRLRDVGWWQYSGNTIACTTTDPAF